MTQLEHICDVKGTKPKIFEIIDNEFAEGREKMAVLEEKLDEKIDNIRIRMDNHQSLIEKMDLLSQVLTNKADSLNAFT